MWTPEPTEALALTVRLAAVAACVDGLEIVAVRHAFSGAGVFADSSMGDPFGRPARLRRYVGGHIFAVGCAAVASAAAVALLGPERPGGRAALLVLVTTRLSLSRYRVIGGDGAEQMTSIVLVAATLAILPGVSEARATVAAVFIGAQTVLAYTTAGVAKVLSPAWRDGSAVGRIVATATYGCPPLADALAAHVAAARLLSWTVIVFEIGFGLALLGPDLLVTAALAIGFSFHLTCAVTMGLNDFLLAFPATYPCVVLLAAIR